MKSHGKSKAVLTAVIFEVNLLQSSRFGDAIINALDLILKQKNAIPNNSSLKQLFPQNPHQ